MFRHLVCFCLCLISCVFAFGQKPAPAADASPNVVGTWEGTLDAGTAKLKLVLRARRWCAAKLASAQGRISIDHFLAVTSKFEMKSLGASYEGKLDSSGIKSAVSSGRVARRYLSFLTIRADRD
jgi:hypothetical protein